MLMAKTKSIDTPLSEITLRRYEKPYELEKRELIRKLCLSLGLLQPGDSRDVVIDVLYILLIAKKKKEVLNSAEITKKVIELRKNEKLPMLGIASSNIRRQLLRLRDLFIVEKVKNNYRITEFLPLAETFETKVEGFMIRNITERVKEYLAKIDEKF